jgi:hypothetical protein
MKSIGYYFLTLLSLCGLFLISVNFNLNSWFLLFGLTGVWIFLIISSIIISINVKGLTPDSKPYKMLQKMCRRILFTLGLYLMITICLLVITIIFGVLIPRYQYNSGYLSNTTLLKTTEEKAYFKKILGDGQENDFFFNIPRHERGTPILGYRITNIQKISTQDELNKSDCKKYITKLPDYETDLEIKTLFGLNVYPNWKMCGMSSIYDL